MEPFDERELTDREGGLRELRGVLSTPHRRSSRRSSISGLILGGTTGVIALLGAGGYYGLSILFPPPSTNPVRVNPDLLVDAPEQVGDGAQGVIVADAQPATTDIDEVQEQIDLKQENLEAAPIIASIQPEIGGPEIEPSPPPGEVAEVGDIGGAAPIMEPVALASLQPPASPAGPAPANAASPAGAAQLSPEMLQALQSVADAPAPATGPQGPATAGLSAPSGAAQPSDAPAEPLRSAAPSFEIAALSPQDAAPWPAPNMSGLPATPNSAARSPRQQDAGAPDAVPQIDRSTRELPEPPDMRGTQQIASLGASPMELPDQPSSQAPAWSPMIPSATPTAPDSPQGLQGGARPAEAQRVESVVIPGFVPAPPASGPIGPRLAVAALSEDAIRAPVTDASPVPAMRPVAPGAAPRAVPGIGSVEVASIDESAPKALLIGRSPHSMAPDGAASTVIDSLAVSYPGATAGQVADLGRVASEPVQAAPIASAPSLTAVEVASISPELMLAVGAPVDTAPVALSAPAGSVPIGGAPAELQYSAADPGAPSIPENNFVRLASLEPTVADWRQAALATRLVDPSPPFELPSTPNVTVDPAAAFAEPLDALTSTPAAPAPALASVDPQGAQPPDSLYAPVVPAEPGARHQDDPGRQAALNVVAARRAANPAGTWVDDRPAWIRNGVAPRPNFDKLPVIAIVIDEVGSYGASVEDVRSMSPMVTTSVIPSTPDAAKIALNLRLSRREVLVHLPMEANGEADLGPRPILTGMSDVQVRETTHWHLKQFDGYIGVDSHRGGVATRDRRLMDAVMPELVKRGLIFLDSRNAKDSVAEKAARDAGLLAVGNDFFIDDKRHTGAIYRQLDAAVAHARKHGAAIAIGNPHDVTVQAVKAWMRKNDGETVLVQPLTYVTQVLNGRRGDEIIVAGTPPKIPPPPVAISEVAEKLSTSASKSIGETLSGIAADITESLFKR